MEELENIESRLQEQVKISECLQSMRKNKGWKYFEEELMLRLKASGSRLRKSKKLEDVYHAQGEMDAVEGILAFIPAIIEAGKEAKEELGKGGEHSIN